MQLPYYVNLLYFYLKLKQYNVIIVLTGQVILQRFVFRIAFCLFVFLVRQQGFANFMFDVANLRWITYNYYVMVYITMRPARSLSLVLAVWGWMGFAAHRSPLPPASYSLRAEG